MKTKKVMTLIALLLAGIFVSAQTYNDHQALLLEKASLDVDYYQINVQHLNAHHSAMMSWAQPSLIQQYSFSPANYDRQYNAGKDQAYNGFPSPYIPAENVDEAGDPIFDSKMRYKPDNGAAPAYYEGKIDR